MSILSISTIELLHLWSDLEEALHGTHGFGGDTCELYAYRFGSQGPSYHTITGNKAEADQRSARALFELLTTFQEHHPGCEILVDGDLLAPWVGMRPFFHRTAVKVTPAEEGAGTRWSRARLLVDLGAHLDEAVTLLETSFGDGATNQDKGFFRRCRELLDRVLP